MRSETLSGAGTRRARNNMASLGAIGLMLCLGAPALAQAQNTAPASNQGGIEDIVVTATRVSTNLQDTPIAITAVTSKNLEERGLQEVSDLTSVVPNTQFRRTQGAFGPGVSAFIRGIGQSDTNLGNDPAVAYYIDDIYYPILLGSNFDLLDIDHVEVLRGPQGTLFGRNALAGAVNIVSKQPRFDEASSYIQLTTGAYNRTDVRAGFNMPLGDNLAFMASGAFKKRTGYQKILDFACEMTRRGTPELAGTIPASQGIKIGTPNNAVSDCTIGHLGGEDVRAVRGSFAWEPASNVRVTLTGDYTRDTSENPADTTVAINPALANTVTKNIFSHFGVAYDERFLTGNPYSTYESFYDPIGSGTVIPGIPYYNGRPNRGGAHLDPHGKLTNWGVSAKVVVNLTSQIDLTAIVGYRVLNETHLYSKDGTPLMTEMTVNDVSNKYATGEVRLSGKMDWIDWVAGAFYFDAQGTQHAIVDSPRNSSFRILYNTFDPTSKAVYANATIRPFGDRLSFTGGLRYSDDKKVAKLTNLLDTSTPTAPAAGDIRFNVTPKDQRLSWKAGINYELTDDILLYASAATGYTIPGFNPRPQQPSQVAQFDGNEDIAYELGTKLDLFNRRLRLNGALFYTDFKNRPQGIGGNEILLTDGQATPGSSTVVPLPNGPDGSTTCRPYDAAVDGPVNPAAGVGVTCIFRTFYQNTPAKIWGFELEATAEPIDGLMINGALGYHKFTAPELKLRPVNRRQNEPFWQANAGIQYEIQGAPLDGTITPRVDWSWQSSTATSQNTIAYNQPAYSLVNARITYAIPDEGFSVALGATNLFSKVYYHNYFVYQDSGDAQVQGQVGAPRQWYLTISKNF